MKKKKETQDVIYTRKNLPWLPSMAQPKIVEIDGRKVAIAGSERLLVSRGVSESDLFRRWIPLGKPIVFRIPSSNKDREYYEVQKIGDTWWCPCEGFSFRSCCRHVEIAKEFFKITINNNKN